MKQNIFYFLQLLSNSFYSGIESALNEENIVMEDKNRLLSPSISKNNTKNEDEVISTSYAGIILLIWLLNNIFVTLTNKVAFAKVDFTFPYILSTVHIACNLIGSQIYFYFVSPNHKSKTLEPNQRKSILIFSTIFTLNIALGNMSLRWVSVNFNQITRALVPVIVMGISMIWYSKIYSTNRKWAVLPVVIGVGLTFFGDISTSYTGAFYTFLCIFFGALKVVMAGELLVGDLKLHPIDLLSKMCPLALIQCIALAYLQGEVYELSSKWDNVMTTSAPRVVLLSGILSFALNVSSFTANKCTSPLTLSIAANVKQVLLVVTATFYFQDPVPLINGMGIIVVIVASFRYGIVSSGER